MATSKNVGGWKTSQATSVLTSSGWKKTSGFVNTGGGVWKPLDLPTEVAGTYSTGYLGVYGPLYGNRFGDMYGYQSSDNATDYPSTGVSTVEPIVLNGARIMAIATTFMVVGRITVISSFIKARDLAAFNFKTVTINSVTYQRSAFTEDFYPSSDPHLNSLYLPDVIWHPNQSSGVQVSFKFNL